MGLQDLLKEAKAAEVADKSGNSLFLCLLGVSGAGKSHCVGTLGVKTLHLYFQAEKHGVKAAKKEGGDNVVPYCLDFANGKELDADEVLTRLRKIMSTPEELLENGFKAIFLDGLSELDVVIGNSKELKKKCLTKGGSVDGFRLSGETQKIANGVVKLFLTVQRLTGIHVITSCILDVSEFGDRNEILACSPKLSTYGLASSLLQMYSDRIIISSQLKDDGTKVRVFDNMVDLVRVSKDDRGVTKKVMMFEPRLSSGEMPKLMRADLSKVVEIKNG